MQIAPVGHVYTCVIPNYPADHLALHIRLHLVYYAGALFCLTGIDAPLVVS